MVWEKLSRVFQNSTKVDEIQGTYRGMTIATEPDNWSHLKALSLPQLAHFLLDAGCTSEFEVFPQAATLPQKEKTTFDSELTSPSSFYSKASRPGSAFTLTGLADVGEKADWGIVIGKFYNYEPRRCCWMWCYIIWLDSDSKSAAGVSI